MLQAPSDARRPAPCPLAPTRTPRWAAGWPISGPADQTIRYQRTAEFVDIVQGRRRSRTELYRGLARKGLTLRQLIVEHPQDHAHYRFTGSFEQIADELQLWFDADGADGLVLSFNNGAAGVHGFIEHVVPRLQDRGLFRRDYMCSTLREHLGLPIPG